MARPHRECRLIATVPHYQCRGCDEWKPSDSYYRLAASLKSVCGVHPRCKECARKADEKYRARKTTPTVVPCPRGKVKRTLCVRPANVKADERRTCRRCAGQKRAIYQHFLNHHPKVRRPKYGNGRKST